MFIAAENLTFVQTKTVPLVDTNDLWLRGIPGAINKFNMICGVRTMGGL